MLRSNTTTQEVSCTVVLSTALHPALLHRKAASAASAPAGVTGSGGDSGASLKEACVPGAILEVRQLWQPPSLETSGQLLPPSFSPPPSRREATVAPCSPTPASALYAFVRVKEADHRLSGWFPLHHVYMKLSTALSVFADGAAVVAAEASTSAAAATRGLGGDDMVRLSSVLHRPWLSGVYDAVTPGMARTQRARRQLDYLEERLLRDCRTPTTVRFFVYLNTYVFAPWYYAPFGLLNSEYDPMLPCSAESWATTSEASSAASSTHACQLVSATQPQPYIRDAFFCPFSLRLFSTYAQMHYETRRYRAGRLRPPGEEVYRDEARGLSLFKINGSQHVTYCRHLFLIGKSFLENKLAGHDVHSYYFYVMCLHHRYFPHYVSDPSAMYFAGFFTWEKHVCEYNLACITTLPCFGRRAAPRRASSPVPAECSSGSGATHAASPSLPASSPPPVLRNLGQFMIAVSYELAYRRKQVGTPEKPLSDLGAVAYQHFWRRALVRWMKETLNAMRRAIAVDVDGAAATEGMLDAENTVPTVGGAGPGAPAFSACGAVEVLMVTTEPEEEAAEEEEVEKGRMTGRRLKPAVGARKRLRHPSSDGEDTAAEEPSPEGRPASPSPHGNAAVRVLTVRSSTTTLTSAVSAPPPSSPPSTETTSTPGFTRRTTIKDIAAAVRLEEADVLKTLLGLGVLHRSSEDRSIQLLLPQRYVDWMYDEVLRWESSLEHAVFQPALLKTRGAGTRG